jgi:ankyrin repeat protein
MPEVRSGTERLNAALLQAVLIGNRTAAGYLLDYGADIEARARMELPAWGRWAEAPSALHTAVKYGATPLMLAAVCGQPELLRLLLDRGARIDARDDFHRDAIYFATKMGYHETTRLLLQAAAGIQYGGADEAALRRWVMAGYPDRVGALLDRGADINTKDDRGRTPLMWAAVLSRTRSPDSRCNHVATARLLLERGADIDAQNQYGLTALMLAGGKTQVVRLLLSHGADVTLQDHRGRTALANATIRGNIEVQELLRQAGAKE